MKRKITARAIILDDDGKLFCVRLKGYGGKNERDFWCLPGGGMYPAEPIVQTLRREMIEETGIKAQVGNLLYIQQFVENPGEEQLEFFFHVTNTDDYKDIDISGASHAEEEIAEYGFVDPKAGNILPEFLTTEDIAAHIASNSPTKIFNYL